MTRNYFAYIRVSTAKQGEHGSSLQEQRAAIEAYAVRNGLTITEWFEERETAAKLGRRLFNSMIAQVTRGKAVGIVIHKIDRSARNLKDWALIGELIDKGVDVHFAHESLDLASRGGRLAADIQAVVAADYIRNLRDEVLKGFYGRLKQGLFPLPAPIGYVDRGRGQPKAIDPISGPLIRQAFDLYCTGRYGIHALHVEMERRGLRNRAGSRVSFNSMNRILRNPFYMGLIQLSKTGETFDGAHPPLIRKATFDRVQAIMSGRSYFTPKKHVFAFARLIKCAACGRSLIGERQKGHAYYRCHTRTCRGTSLRGTDIQDRLCALLSLLTFDDGELGDLRDLREEAGANDSVERAAAVAQAKLRLGRCNERLARLTDVFLDQAIDRETFDARKAELLSERRGHLEAVSGPAVEGRTLALIKKLELGNTALSKAESDSVDEKRHAVNSVISNLSVERNELVFRLQFPFDRLAQERISHDGAPFQVEHRNGDHVLTGVSGRTVTRREDGTFVVMRSGQNIAIAQRSSLDIVGLRRLMEVS